MIPAAQVFQLPNCKFTQLPNCALIGLLLAATGPGTHAKLSPVVV
jgi:hypothetical protein